MTRAAWLALVWVGRLAAGGLDVSATRLPDLGAAPAPEAAEWYDSNQTPGDLRGRPWVLWCGGVAPEDLPAGRPPPSEVLQLLEELREVDPTGDLVSVALFDELTPFEARRGKPYSQLEVAVLGGSFWVAAGKDRLSGRRSCWRMVNERFRAFAGSEPGDGVYLVVDRGGRVRWVGALDPSPRVRRRATRAQLEAAVRAVAGVP